MGKLIKLYKGTSDVKAKEAMAKARLAKELWNELENEESEAEVAPPHKKMNKGKTVPKTNPFKRKNRRSNRPVSSEEQEVVKKTEAKSITFEDIIQFATQSDTTFHGTPIELKDEPIEFGNLVFPKIILEAEKKKKREPRKKVLKGPIKLHYVPQIVKPIENTDDYLYKADIQEYSDLNLFLDELIEVRGIDKYKNMPERLMFVYKGGVERPWPLQRILGEGYPTLVKVFSSFKSTRGFSQVERGFVIKQIEKIRASWNSPESLPMKLKISYNGQKIHLQPFWMMEFRDEDGRRRFFRLEDQLSKASTKYLRWLQSKLDPKIVEEDNFNNKLRPTMQDKERQRFSLPERRKGTKIAQTRGALSL
ncbi:hypothetical protein POM88_015388 [Heracleum sosnowskyi]|uniref:Uncharacterized protein n=1 Tax=Heracleum sosnowskyi TaxID=360622 RepID=A0AAD8MS00_9APIA|nr:hypothetical protein POM88_015388 [Heracleum sosnowskyi]